MSSSWILALGLGLCSVAVAQEVEPEAPVVEPPVTEAPVVEPPVVEPPPTLSPEELEALLGRIAALEKQVTAQRIEQARQRGERANTPDLRFEIEGAYRARGYLFAGMFDGLDRPATYMDHRLRITPGANYKDLAKLQMTIDALDSVVWGDNASLASTALFAGGPSVNDNAGRTVPSVRIERLWTEMRLPVGVMRVGRQANHLGMGILANSGNGFDQPFGEKRGGSTVDRVLFATRPISVAQALAGKKDAGIPLIAAVAVDRLVESPLIEYYGYRCTSGITQEEDRYDPRCDRSGDGVTDLDHGFTDESRTEGQRTGGWWAQPNDDVYQLLYVLTYQGKDLVLFDRPGELIAGGFIVDRRQRQTRSNVLVLDAHLRLVVHGAYFEGEALHIRGKTRAIALPGSVNTADPDDPLYKQANIWGYVMRGGYTLPFGKAVLEHGYASGDDNVADDRFTGRPLHPDYKVGLILYDQVLARASATLWGDPAAGLWSNGGVYNSRYVFPHVTINPFPGWAAGETEVVGGFVMVWPDKPDGAIIRCRQGDAVDCTVYGATQSPIGWEVDLAIKHRWHKHLLASIEGGFAKVTDRIPLAAIGLDPAGNVFTLQARAGFEF